MTLLSGGLPTAAEVWAQWTRGVADRRSPFRTPTVATVGPDGLPGARTVVLREARLPARQLVLYSDRRAGKVAALAARPVLAWHFWNPRHQLQIRAIGSATLHTDDATADAAFARLSPHQQRSYAASPAPGAILPSPGDGLPPEARVADARARFCVVVSTISQIDVLVLSRAGHRRALLRWTETAWQADWCVP